MADDVPGSAPDNRPWVSRLVDEPGEIIPLMIRAAAARPVVGAGGGVMSALPPKSGILVVDKPSGQTSHDVVQAIRRASGIKRVGHAGTLDPLATGVLIVALESATRVIPDLQDTWKGYRAVIQLGASTSTYDREGEILARSDPSGISAARVVEALQPFIGDIWQVPPMVSALKHEGRRLYDLARQGIEVEREPRQVTVRSLELVNWAPPNLTLSMEVSKGTYVRSIAHDLGQALGVGAHVTELQRTFVGPFHLRDSTRLATTVEAFVEGYWPTILLPLDAALLHYSAMIVTKDGADVIRRGQQLDAPPPKPDTTRLVRVYDDEGRFVALVKWDDVTGRWQPDRVFAPASKATDGLEDPVA